MLLSLGVEVSATESDIKIRFSAIFRVFLVAVLHLLGWECNIFVLQPDVKFQIL